MRIRNDKNVKDNNYLGKFVLSGIPKTLRGVPKIKAGGQQVGL